MQIPSLGALARFLSRIRHDRRGVTAITLALTMPVLIGAVGGAIDYSRYLTSATQLQDAVDAASVGAVATNSPGFMRILFSSLSTEGRLSLIWPVFKKTLVSRDRL